MKLPIPQTNDPWAARLVSTLERFLTQLERKVQANGTSIPAGVVVQYNKPNVPRGWIICDGRNGTPDMRPATYIMKVNKAAR